MASLLIVAASPTSTNYVLPSYDFGSGGTDGSTSTSYSLNGISGTQDGSLLTSTSYSLQSGVNGTMQANVPAAPTLSNPSNYYDKLALVLDDGGNPTDTVFLIAISPDNFTTTYYVQPDNGISATYTLATYRTYASYGGGSGFLVLGLSPSTTYKAKVRAIRGSFTESGFSPESSAVATSGKTLTFGVTTTLTSTPPFTANFSSLPSGSIVAADADISLSLTTNANSGGSVYIKSANAALTSSAAGSSITSATADLASVQSGYGAQIQSATQVSGGPIVGQSPYNGAADNVGVLVNNLSELLKSANPVTGMSATVRLKAKSNALTPASTDYADTLTLVAAMNY